MPDYPFHLFSVTTLSLPYDRQSAVCIPSVLLLRVVSGEAKEGLVTGGSGTGVMGILGFPVIVRDWNESNRRLFTPV